MKTRRMHTDKISLSLVNLTITFSFSHSFREKILQIDSTRPAGGFPKKTSDFSVHFFKPANPLLKPKCRGNLSDPYHHVGIKHLISILTQHELLEIVLKLTQEYYDYYHHMRITASIISFFCKERKIFDVVREIGICRDAVLLLKHFFHSARNMETESHDVYNMQDKSQQDLVWENKKQVLNAVSNLALNPHTHVGSSLSYVAVGYVPGTVAAIRLLGTGRVTKEDLLAPPHREYRRFLHEEDIVFILTRFMELPEDAQSIADNEARMRRARPRYARLLWQGQKVSALAKSASSHHWQEFTEIVAKQFSRQGSYFESGYVLVTNRRELTEARLRDQLGMLDRNNPKNRALLDSMRNGTDVEYWSDEDVPKEDLLSSWHLWTTSKRDDDGTGNEEADSIREINNKRRCCCGLDWLFTWP
eukprot:g325.t1